MKATKRALISSAIALLICFSMLLGTTYAWFTDEVSSKGNIIQTGTLDVGMFWVEGDEAVPAVGDKAWIDASTGAMFDNTRWEPGYIEAKHILITNDGTLALKYKLRIVAEGVVSKLANVIDVYYFDAATQLTRDTATTGTRIGTLAEVLGTGESSLNALYRHVNGSLAAGENRTLTLALKMQEEAGNEYQNLSIGTSFRIELIAAQKTSEKDSFNDQYDAKVPDEEIPYALVTPLEGDELNIKFTYGIGGEVDTGKLNTGYKFEPTIFNQNPDGNNVIDDVDSSLYKHWHADFYVYADRDVPADSIGLAGYYDAWCQYNDNNWVALTNDGLEIKAGEGIRLVDSMGVGCVTYKNICQYGNDGIGFMCGAFAINPEALAGTTLTVELRIYKTDVEWTESSHGSCNETVPEEYITVGEFKYTFPGIEVADQEELNDAIANGIGGVVLGSGEYTMPASAKGKNITIIGNGDTVVKVVDSGAAEGDIDYSLEGANVTFENVTLNIQGNDHPGYARVASATYNNCTITGSNFCLYGDSVFNNCTFNLSNGYVWTWGAANVEFNGCTFNAADANGTAKAILVHNTTETKVYVRDCTFNGSTTAKTWDGIPVAAVSIDPEVGSPDATVYFEGTNTYSAAFNGLYQVKYADELDDVKVYVDNALVENVPVGENDK